MCKARFLTLQEAKGEYTAALTLKGNTGNTTHKNNWNMSFKVKSADTEV